jgi:hypothetical protein
MSKQSEAEYESAISLATICHEIHPKSIEKLRDLAMNMGMANYSGLNKEELCHSLSTMMGMRIAAENIRGAVFSKLDDSDEGDSFIEYIKNEAPDIVDPIMHSIMINPIIVSSGIHYDRSSIEQWFRSSTRRACPITNKKLERVAYLDLNMRDRIERLLAKYGVKMDIQRDPTDTTKIKLWDDVPQTDGLPNTVIRTNVFFNSNLVSAIGKPKYLHESTVFTPEGWRRLYYMASANMKFNDAMELDAEKKHHDLGCQRLIEQIVSGVERPEHIPATSSFDENKKKLISVVKSGIRHFTMITKYMADNYIADSSRLAFSTALLHVFVAELQFVGMEKLNGYSQYQKSELWGKPPGFYKMVPAADNYFYLNPLLV